MNVPEPIFAKMVELRRDLHRYPELSWKEERTSRRIREELDRIGLAHRVIARHGIIADVAGEDPQAPMVALRADMDALPIFEETGLPFSSSHEGVMHACGHDGHTSILVGAAEMLAGRKPPVGVRLIWQPAEELANGAEAMIAEGCLDGVAAIFSGHVDRHYAPGTLVVTPGAVNASTDLFSIEIQGRQGHGARPHEALDAVVVGSLLVTALQTIVSREIDPAHPSVISVGSFHAGSAPNVIAGRATLEGTIRSQSAAVRDHLHRSLRRIAEAVGTLHQARIVVDIDRRTPPLINAPAMVSLAREAARQVVDEEAIVELHTVNMGGEDFACYLEHVPGCYIRYGAQVEGRESFPAHSSQFDFDERALATGAAWLDAVARVAGARIRAGALPFAEANP
jgi:amidohydrolase